LLTADEAVKRMKNLDPGDLMRQSRHVGLQYATSAIPDWSSFDCP